MYRRDFHRELDGLVREVLGLGREVEACLGSMVEAVEGWDADVAGRMVGSDVSFKGRGAKIADECMVLQARQAPVARDLRLVYTAQALTNHLVRTGTLCEHICSTPASFRSRDKDRRSPTPSYALPRRRANRPRAAPAAAPSFAVGCVSSQL